MGQTRGVRHDYRYGATTGTRLASLPCPSKALLEASYREQMAAAKRAQNRNEHQEAFRCLARAAQIESLLTPAEKTPDQIARDRWR